MWRVLKCAINGGLAPDALCELEIEVTPPTLIARDRLQEAQRNQILFQNKIQTAEQWAEAEAVEFEPEALVMQQPPPQLGGMTKPGINGMDRNAEPGVN